MNEPGFLAALGQYHFLRNALLAGLLAGTTCAALSIHVVLKRLAFIGQGISHAGFAGIAIGLVLAPAAGAGSLTLEMTTALYCIGVAVAIAAVSRGGVSEDTAIGILFTVSMAAGLIIIGLRKAYTADLMSYLFGSILGVTGAHLLAMLAAALLIALALLLFGKEWRYFLFDEEMARVSGLPTRALHYALHVMLAVAVVVSMKVVGIILANAFLIIPGATALLIAKEFRQLIVVSQVISAVSVVSGLWVSYAFDVAPGATIVIAQFTCFAAAWIATGGLKKRTV